MAIAAAAAAAANYRGFFVSQAATAATRSSVNIFLVSSRALHVKAEEFLRNIDMISRNIEYFRKICSFVDLYNKINTTSLTLSGFP